MEEEIDRVKRGRVQASHLPNEAVGHHLKRPVIVAGTLLIGMCVAPNVGHKQTRQGFVPVKKGVSNNLEIIIPNEFMVERVGIDERAE